MTHKTGNIEPSRKRLVVDKKVRRCRFIYRETGQVCGKDTEGNYYYCPTHHTEMSNRYEEGATDF